ncbi:MAG: putative lipopolysaccharide heptosyltransferase III [Rhodocyclaceae bacterium]|nr:putative lipopolysaccharide heptosyltransferase III [Rhodocyclaceae bacterium]
MQFTTASETANPRAIPLDQLKRALVIKLRHHGDVLLASPVFTALKHAAPHCEIDALVYAETAPMLAGHPAVSRLFAIDRQWKRLGWRRRIHAELSLLHDLRARDYDIVIHLCVHRRGAWLARLLRPRWSVAPRHRGDFWANSFTHFYAAQSRPDRHTVESNLDALRALGIELHEEDKRVTIASSAEEIARIDALLTAHGFRARKFVHIHPTSRWTFKCWPMDRFGPLVRKFSRAGWPVVLTSAPDARERAMVRELLAHCATSGTDTEAKDPAPILDLSGQLTLSELAALAGRARLFVGVDSAPMHIAAAQAVPVVALFGPSGEKEWAPWRTPSRLVVSALHPCRPCGQDGCQGTKISACLTTIPVDAVWQACCELLEETAP